MDGGIGNTLLLVTVSLVQTILLRNGRHYVCYLHYVLIYIASKSIFIRRVVVWVFRLPCGGCNGTAVTTQGRQDERSQTPRPVELIVVRLMRNTDCNTQTGVHSAFSEAAWVFIEWPQAPRCSWRDAVQCVSAISNSDPILPPCRVFRLRSDTSLLNL